MTTVSAVVQGAATSTAGRAVATALAAGALVAAIFVIRRLGRPFKQRYPDDDVEAVEAVVFCLLAVVAAWVIVLVWGALPTVRSRLAAVEPSAEQGMRAMVAVLTLIIAYTLTRVTKGLLERRGGGVIDAHRREAAHHVIQLGIFAMAAAVVLSLLTSNPENLLFGAGAAGLVLGFAARQTLGSVLAGFVLLFSRPFEVGDWTVVDEREGVVTDITLFNTELRTYDGEHVVIPNDEVANSQVVNRSRSGRLRCSVDVGVDYDVDVGRAVEVAESAVRDCSVDPLLSEPAPTVVCTQFGDSAVVLDCRFWIYDPSAPRMWETQTAVIEAIKDAFEREGIKIPFPQRELMGRQEQDGFRVTGPTARATTPGDATADGSGRTPARAAGDGDQDPGSPERDG